MDAQFIQKLIAIRRSIHENPELGYQEFKTSELIQNELTQLNISYQQILGTVIVATIKKGEGPTILLRSDIDALPIHELSNVPFSSKTAGVMHACGHDLHTTILIGAAHVLSSTNFNGTVLLVFQPSEEGNKNDPFALANEVKKSGGQRIVESGLLEGVTAAIGLHMHPLIKTGEIAYCLGEALAATTYFNIEIKGVGGHAAFPQVTVDPIYIASKLIVEAQGIIARSTDPAECKVLSFTNIKVGKLEDEFNTARLPNAENIIPGIVTIQGTLRALNLSVFESIKQKLKALAESFKMSDGADITIEYTLDYPCLKNDHQLHNKLEPVLETIFGKEHIHEIKPQLGSEDFAFYSQKIPVMFYYLGSNDGTNKFFLHHPQVVFDEACIEYGIELMTRSVTQLLPKKLNK